MYLLLVSAILTPMFNGTFYKFLFSFIAVLAGALVFILVLGASAG